MSEVVLHPVPRLRDVVREQIAVMGASLRREALVAALVLGIMTAAIGFDIVRGNADSWFDSDEWAPLGVISFLLPYAVWRRERRFEPDFFWTLPADRRRLAQAKVFAGWVWLMAAVLFFFLWQTALAMLARVAGAETVSYGVFTGVTAAYLVGSALVLGLRHPVRWLLATAALFVLLSYFNQAAGSRPDGIDRLFGFNPLQPLTGAMARWQLLPGFARWAIGTAVSLGAGLALLSAAIARHGEKRRR